MEALVVIVVIILLFFWVLIALIALIASQLRLPRDGKKFAVAVKEKLERRKFPMAAKLICRLPSWPIRKSLHGTIIASSDLFLNLEAASTVVGSDSLATIKCEVVDIMNVLPYLAGKLASLNFQTKGRYRRLTAEARNILEKEARELDAISDACKTLSRVVHTFTASGRIEYKELDDGTRRLKAQAVALHEVIPII
jgi:hypothetical protein